MNKRILLWGLIAFVFISCRKEFKIDYPELSPTLVVNCLFTHDSIFNIQVSRLTVLNDNSTDTIIRNAKLTLYENGTFFDLAQYNSQLGFYQSTKTAQAGNSYRLTVEAEGFPVATASDKLPDTLFIDSTNLYCSAYYDSWQNQHYDKVELFFSEPAPDNYYEIFTFTHKYYEYEGESENIYTIPTEMTSFDPIILSEGILDEEKYRPSLVFSDNLLANNAEVNFLTCTGVSGTSFPPDGYTVLRNVSKNYYLFRKQWYKYLDTNGAAEMSGMAQFANMSFVASPLEAYTNVENGLGIFAGYIQTEKLMTVKTESSKTVF